MRKIFIGIIPLFLSINTYSQLFFDGGLKGMIGPTMLINENVFKDSDYEHQISFGYGFGGKLGVNFNESIQIATEIIFSAFSQKFAINEDGDTWEKQIKFRSIDIPFLIRHNKSNGSYFEIGPQYTIVKKVSETIPDLSVADASPYFDKNYFAGVVGFGGYLIGWENFGISTGFRISYTLADIVSSDNKAPAGTYTYRAANYPPDKSYKPSNPLTFVFVLELNYDLGYLAKSPCGGRRKFMFFN